MFQWPQTGGDHKKEKKAWETSHMSLQAELWSKIQKWDKKRWIHAGALGEMRNKYPKQKENPADKP